MSNRSRFGVWVGLECARFTGASAPSSERPFWLFRLVSLTLKRMYEPEEALVSLCKIAVATNCEMTILHQRARMRR